MYIVQFIKNAANPEKKMWSAQDRFAFNRAGYKSAMRGFAEAVIEHGTYYELRVILQIGAGAPTVICANSARGFEVGE